jgi:hypothetical protein
LTLTSSEWLKKLKVAFVQKNFDKLEELLKIKPTFKPSEFEEAQYLLKEIFLLSVKTKDEVGAKMEKVKRNIEFTKASITQPHHKLNKKF